MNQQSEVTQRPTQNESDDCDLRQAEIQSWLKERVAEITALEPDDINVAISFERYGLDSSDAIVLSGDLQDWLECELEPELLFDYPTIETLSEYLVKNNVQPSLPDGNGDRFEANLEPEPSEAPLSHGQRALWFVQKLAPESYAYNVAFTASICSPLDVSLLQRIFQKLTDRHPMLRTTFLEKDGEPYQKSHEQWDVCFEKIDASTWSEEELTQEAIATHQRPFSLEQGPLLRVSLFNRSEQERLLLISLHHIICDGWSVWMLLDELRVLYEAEQQNVSALLPPLKFSYGDYVSWQHELLAGTQGEILWRYWQQQLAGELPVLNLPTDRPRPPVQSHRGASHSFRLSPSLTEQLKKLAESEGTSLYMTLLAAFQVLLHRYTGQEDILVGSPMKCRNQPQWGGVFGYFVNPVVMRANLSGNPKFKDFLFQVRRTVLNAIAHQDYPFALLVDRLQPERASSHSPLFQTMFILQKPQKTGDILDLFSGGEGRVNWGGIELEAFDIPQQEGQFDLTLEMMDVRESVIGVFKYDADLFDAATIFRLEAHFQTLLQGIVTQPEQHVARLPILPEAEQHQLLVEWNQTQADVPQKCLHELFEEQVENSPDAVALLFKDEQLTYRQLNQRANQLAHYLKKLGVGPEVLVGLCLERSVDMIVGLLGILKAGGAYVPLDPTYPNERLAYMLQDSQAPVLLIQEKLQHELPEHKARTVCLDTDSQIAAQSTKNPTNYATVDNLAYVIYTSGSTGKPKGVLVTHRGLGNLAQAQRESFNVKSDSRVLQFASLSFDASIYEVVMSLCSGASLALATRDALLPGTALIQTLQKYAITHVTLPPSALAVMPDKDLPDLECLSVAGEACSPQLVQQWSRGRRFFNAYGPTEATVCATVAQVSDGETPPPIGRPLLNTQLYILDRYLQPVPIGVPGELHIGGIGLARGYLNRPELTQEKFIANPFNLNVKSSQLYKTGDLVRYLRDGNIEFLGRIDHQVKIRGFRIELGEIEAALAQHPQVREVLVIARKDKVNNRLVAYLVASKTASVSELRSFLKQHLPEYMMPSAFVLLDEMPLTPNGKIDRRALPAPELNRNSLDSTFAAPRTPHEEVLTAIWAEVLGLEEVGIDDNFFELGGDSILSLQVVSRANQANLRLTPQQLFQHQTIAELATVIGTTKEIEAEQGLVFGSVPLTPIQHWFFEEHPPEPHHFNQAVLLEVEVGVKPERLKQAVEQLQQHHDALRLRFIPADSGWKQHIESNEDVSFQTIDLSALSAPEQAAEIDAKASQLQASLNLTAGPIMQVALFTLGEHHGRLLIIIHHLAVDGVSWRILLEDLASAYQQLSQGATVQLPPKTTSWKYWAEQLQEYAQSEASVKELSYWQAQSNIKVVPLPTDYALNRGEEANTVADADTVSVTLSEEHTRVLLQEVPAVYNTQINDVLLAALMQTFAGWTGERSLLVDLEGHGREDLFAEVDLTRTVGWFTTVFPVLLQLGASDAPGEALKSVKEQLRRIPRRGIGYGILRYLSKTQIEMPPAPVSFNYLGQFDSLRSASPLLGWATESKGQAHSPAMKRRHLLEVNSLVTSGRLQLEWTYSQKVHQRATVENLARGFVENLLALISHCQSPNAGGYTPSDFPLAPLDEGQFEQLMLLIESDRQKKVEDIYPLSPMQQVILSYNLSHPGSGEYFEQLRLTLHELDVEAFKQAWQQVIARHPILRTAFSWQGMSEPLQVVYRQVEIPWEQYDWQNLATAEQEKQLAAFLESQRKQGLEFGLAPLLRFVLVQLAANTYEFVLSFHHILLDGWSFWGSVVQEALAFYAAARNGTELRLEPPLSYRTFIAKLQQNRSRDSAFWYQGFKDFSAPTPLAIASKSSCQDNQQDEQSIHLSQAATAYLQAFVQQHRLTVSTVVHGAWALLLSYHSGSEDVVFGTTVSGRLPELETVEKMVGLLSNTLPLRVQVSREAPLLPWLQQLQKQQAELAQHVSVSWLEIQSWSAVPPDLSLFETDVVFENYPLDAALLQQSESLQVSNVQHIGRIERPLTVMAMPGQELVVHFLYRTSRYDATTISQLLGQYQMLLERIQNSPEQQIGALLQML